MAPYCVRGDQDGNQYVQSPVEVGGKLYRVNMYRRLTCKWISIPLNFPLLGILDDFRRKEEQGESYLVQYSHFETMLRGWETHLELSDLTL